MKIIQVVSSFDVGGAERVAINIAKSNSGGCKYYLFEVVKGHSVFSEKLKSEIRESGVHYYCSPFKRKKIAICLFSAWFLWKYLIIRPDIIHSHTEIPDFALWLFRKIAWCFFWIRPKYVRTIHNTELWNQWETIGKVVEAYYQKYSCNVAISTSTQGSYVKSYGGSKPPIIYNGVEELPQEKFPYLKVGKVNVLFAGRLEYQKGIDELIAVVSALKDDPRFFFHIVGDGTMCEKLLQVVSNLKTVAVYPKIYKVSAYLGSFDFLFMPSNHEGLALLSIEASMARTPTIINACPGLKDTLPNDWPLAVKDNSVQGFIKIFRGYGNLDYLALCDKAHDYAVANFLLIDMQHKYEMFYAAQI